MERFCSYKNFTFFFQLTFIFSQQQLYLIQSTSYRSSFVFFVPGIFYPNNNSTVFYVNILVNTLIDQVSHFGGILSWGGFCPDNNFTVFYVYHYSKQSYRSSLVFFCIFLSWGDFIPTTTLLYSMYNILVNTLIDQVLHFWGILSRQQFYHILCTPLQ